MSKSLWKLSTYPSPCFFLTLPSYYIRLGTIMGPTSWFPETKISVRLSLLCSDKRIKIKNKKSWGDGFWEIFKEPRGQRQLTIL